MDCRRFVPSVLDRVSYQVLEETYELCLVAAHYRQRINRDRDAALLDGRLQVRQRLLHRLAAVNRGKPVSRSRHAGIGEQVLDELLHPGGAVDNVMNELVGLFIQFSLVAAVKQLGEPRHHPERLLKIVRGDGSKRVQFTVVPFQLGRVAPHVLLGFFSPDEIADLAAEGVEHLDQRIVQNFPVVPSYVFADGPGSWESLH